MASRQNPKRDRLLDETRSLLPPEVTDPALFFQAASADDLEHYSPTMLAAATRHGESEVRAFDGKKARVTITRLDDVAFAGQPSSILTITGPNMPFLYDSIMGEVTSSHRDISLAVHPILIRMADGSIRARGSEGADGQPISHIQLHLAPLTPAQAERLTGRLHHVLDQVSMAISDWKPMLATLDRAVEALAGQAPQRRQSDRDEAIAFLNWLRDDNFTFLGMRDYVYSGKGKNATVERGKGTGLGILSDPDVLVLRQGKDAVTTTPEILAFLQGPDLLIVTKANVKSVVHRRAYMDYIGVKRFNEDGSVAGELRIVGLFTSTAYTGKAADIPLLRMKVEKVIDHFGFDPASHSGRILQNTLESYPRDDLFQIEPSLLARFAEQINELSDRPRVRVLSRVDHFDRFVSVLVYVPREEYNSAIRERIGTYLKTVYDGRVSAYYPAFPEGGVARVHFIIGRSDGPTPRIPQARLEADIRAITERWDERFVALAGPKAPMISVSQAFEEAFTPEEAVSDLPAISACLSQKRIKIAFHQPAGTSQLYLKIFHAGSHLALSRRVPLLENLGFTVISERTFDIEILSQTGEGGPVVLHDMELQLAGGSSFDLSRDRGSVEDAFLAAFEGRIDNDGFNRLVVGAGLSARAVTVLRAYARYLQQAGIAWSQGYIAETLSRHPVISGHLYRLFETRLDPALSARQRAKQEASLTASIEEGLQSVPSLDEDRILRRMLNAIHATLRTNYFQRDAEGQPKAMLAFKLDPKQLDGLPEPRPFREIYVYGVEVEGVHLRFGKVARGGIRWSDRGQDYRTEVLGLVKAQQVKNAVIVPVGAKGGFFPKRLPVGGNRDQIFAAGTEAYKTYIRTLLSLTDNIEGQEIVPPKDTVRLDGDDPYFVVAADKGTATFSDTANGLAQEAGFWLDDAFASGGSAGYDHKKMGITARGAWEAVKRHFRELDIDIQTTPFTVAGVGDMSGDVFGNGMLLSTKIRLVAAFDHRDIFIDPDPDMAKTFRERQRLFNLPRSSWQDFDRAVLSKGAMIISRAEKSVRLTPEAQALLGLANATATPFEILSAILTAPVDLLWFGGIGTYIRAASETDAEVGDRTNDPIRVTGEAVRARVIGEGANLGVTQKGRIAFGLKGGRCNSDAIDNSAGVNSSDIEVNIKIALSSAMRDGRLERAKRNQLLAKMTDEVAELVLANNYHQTLTISLTERKGRANGPDLARLMSVLEGQGLLNRKVETLPDAASFEERYRSGKPLTRAEIGVLLSYGKIVLFDELIASSVPDDPWFGEVLAHYFPAKMRKTYAGDIANHRLRREIIATVIANEVINRGGPAFAVTMAESAGVSTAEVVKAAMAVSGGLDFRAIWTAIDGLDGKISGSEQNRIYAEAVDVWSELVRRVLATGLSAKPLAEAVTALSQAARSIEPQAMPLRPSDLADAMNQREDELLSLGIERKLASRLASLDILTVVPDIMAVQAAAGASLQRTTESYFAVMGQFSINALLDSGAKIATSDLYEDLALKRNLAQIATARRDIAATIVKGFGKDKDPAAAWSRAMGDRLDHALSVIRPLAHTSEPGLAKLTVAAGLLADLARGP